MRAQPADHLAPDPSDPDQLVDGAKWAPSPVGDNGSRLGRAHPGQERQRLRGRGVQVHHAVDPLASPGAPTGEREQQHDTKDGGAARHARLSARAFRRLPGETGPGGVLTFVLVVYWSSTDLLLVFY
jgi:hypothetical protein